MSVPEQPSVDFKDLLGDHFLDAVDRDTKEVQRWSEEFESVNVLRFRLGGVVYMAVENPSDGYRSSMDKFFVSEDVMMNVFRPVKVTARMRPNDEWRNNDVLELVDVANGEVILAVGTSNNDDYYPSFVGEWWPDKLAVNAKVEEEFVKPETWGAF
jgi:hypothetical protein